MYAAEKPRQGDVDECAVFPARLLPEHPCDLHAGTALCVEQGEGGTLGYEPGDRPYEVWDIEKIQALSESASEYFRGTSAPGQGPLHAALNHLVDALRSYANLLRWRRQRGLESRIPEEESALDPILNSVHVWVNEQSLQERPALEAAEQVARIVASDLSAWGVDTSTASEYGLDPLQAWQDYRSIAQRLDAVGQRDVLRRLEASLDALDRAVGVGADVTLAKLYEEMRDAEKGAGQLFRRLAIACFAAVVLGAGYAVWKSSGTTLGDQLRHASLGLGLLALGGYLSTQAAQHLKTARWASVMVVQLKTFDAFARDMDNDQRQDLRTYFGRRVFSELPGSVASDGEATASTGLSQAALIDLVSSMTKAAQK